ncbi:MAG: hypothetical protein FWF52_06110 [Candidatus Azobacteroides sp.]|nr:hypothetical protein [Candidatus Azobacteroides sp.]
MNIVKILSDKFRKNPIRGIGTVLTCLGLTLFLLPAVLSDFDFIPKFSGTTTDVFFLCGLILLLVGPVFLIISWIINKELIKESVKLISIGGGWLVIFVFGIGYWLANIMVWISLVLIALGIILPIVAWIINRLKRVKKDSIS